MIYKPDWEKAQWRFEAWWNGEIIDRPVIQVTSPTRVQESKTCGEQSRTIKNQNVRHKDKKVESRWTNWEVAHNLDNPEYVVEKYEEHCEGIYFGGEAFPNLWINLGPGVMAAFIGAEPKISEDTVWFETPKEWDEVLKINFDPENQWWKKICKITSVAVEKGKGRFFTSITDIGGNLDILASLRGSQQLNFDLIEFPDYIQKVSKKINELWFKYYSELCNILKASIVGTSAWMGLWSPKRWYPLQCDFSAMISPKMFEEFVLPSLSEQCRWLDHSIYHWDGPGQIPHLDILLEIKELNGIQWVPGAGAESVSSPKWFPYYKKILKKRKNLVLGWVESSKVEMLIKELGNKGLLLQTSCGTEEEANDLLKQAEKLTTFV